MFEIWSRYSFINVRKTFSIFFSIFFGWSDTARLPPLSENSIFLEVFGPKHFHNHRLLRSKSGGPWYCQSKNPPSFFQKFVFFYQNRPNLSKFFWNFWVMKVWVVHQDDRRTLYLQPQRRGSHLSGVPWWHRQECRRRLQGQRYPRPAAGQVPGHQHRQDLLLPHQEVQHLAGGRKSF